ncbi:prolipoprotein diacylglyceryl transferase [Indioceanicola profundi]|uniref:prolipoprotein diacylglyceryl transferase n=1 Tax=Indioceanicola profundi TaxID=2220096 RepID=UPI000E6ACB90|nr:prolipoprotein diacylglyceryl transferase [Indioceanicola profundi]
MGGIPFPDIDPVALEIGPLVIRWYALAYLAGFLLGWRYAMRLARTKPGQPTADDMDDFLTWAIVGVILGGRIGYVLFYDVSSYVEEPLRILMVWKGGMSFHGGLLGVTAAGLIFSLRRGIHPLALGDVLAVVAPIGLLFGRIANFVNGELYGRVTDVPWGVVFPHGGPLARHPSQLYEALLEGLVLLIVMAVLARRPALRERNGFLTGAFLTGYGLSRFAVEFFREPDAQLGFLFAGTTMGQLLSIPLILIGLVLILVAKSPIEDRQTRVGVHRNAR